MRKALLFICRVIHFVLRHITLIDEKIQQYMQDLSRVSECSDFVLPAARENKDPFFSSVGLITHAGGGLQGMRYLNCAEALEHYYLSGNRVFEFDVHRSTDDAFLLTHSPEKTSKEVFLLHKIDHRFSPMVLENVVDFMMKHEDVSVVLDCKFGNLIPIAEYLVKTVDRESVRQRIILQVFKEQDILDVRTVYNFKLLYVCMYHTDYRQVAEQCLKYDVGAVSISHKALQERTGWDVFTKNNICIFAYTVNRLQDYLALHAEGITGIFSDFLYANDLELGK